MTLNISPSPPPCAVQESRDPRKLHWLFEMLMESPVNGEGGSFVDAWWVESLKADDDSGHDAGFNFAFFVLFTTLTLYQGAIIYIYRLKIF